jgi:DNA-binding GntR family transcriptional regulator
VNVEALKRDNEHERIYKQLLTGILDGTYRPGVRLVESKLALATGVSRTPVREALFRLHQEGFVLTSPRVGFSVKPLDDREAREIFPILANLEAFALSLAAPMVTADVAALRRANQALGKGWHDPWDAIAADTAFHKLMLQRCPNASLLAMVESVRRQLMRYEYIYMADEALIELSTSQHDAIIDCIVRSDFRSAAEAIEVNYSSGLAMVLAKLR